MGYWKIDVDGVTKDFEDDYGFKVKSWPGTGHSPVINRSTDYALQDGALFTGQKMGVRAFTLIGAFYGSATLAAFNAQRQALIKALSSRTTKINTKPATVKLKYTGATDDKEIDVIYEGGLDLAQFTPTFIENDVPVRFSAYNPQFDATSDTVVTLDTETTQTAAYIRGLKDSVWGQLGTDVNGVCRALGVLDNDVYAGGSFTLAGGVADTSRIAKWDGAAWSPLGTGLNNECYAIEIALNDDVYAGGNFSLAGGVTNTAYIAKWDGAAWSALGAGLGAACFAIDIAPNGDIYAGGMFTTAGGGAANYIAKWDGANWSALGTGLNGNCRAVKVAPNGDVYAGGNFTLAGGVANTAYIAKWDGVAWSALGTGLNGACDDIEYDQQNDLLYVGGGFSLAGGVANTSRIASWNGSAWSALSTGLNNDCDALVYENATSALYVVGAFTSAGGIADTGYVAKWDGAAWSSMAVFSTIQLAVDIGQAGFYVGGLQSTLETTDGYTAIEYGGSEVSYPVLKFSYIGGTSFEPLFVSNAETGATITFDYPMQKTEVLTVDLRPGQRAAVSSIYGSVWNAIDDNSDIANFFLQPGNNTGTTENIIVFSYDAVGVPTITAELTYRTAYRSLD